MKRLSKTQLKVIIALNFVLICLMAGLLIWYYPTKNGTIPVDKQPVDDTAEQPYKRVRTADISLNPNLYWQLNIQGSGRDEVVFTYLDEQSDTLFIFGNTTSSDKDFDRRGIFMLAVDVYGKTKETGFFILGGELDVLKDACLCSQGFVLAVEGIVMPYLLIVGFDGTQIKKVDGFISTFESVDSIKYYASGFLLFSQPVNEDLNIKKLRCSFFDLEASYKGSCLADSSYSLTPVEVVVVSNKPIVFCDAKSSLNTLAAVIEFYLTSSAKLTLLYDYPCQIAGFSINNGDYILLTSYNGSSFMRLGSDYKIKQVKTLSQLSPIYFLDLDSQFYAAFLDGSSAVLDYSLMALSSFIHFIPHSTRYIGSSALILGNDCSLDTQNNLSLIVFDKGKQIYNASIGTGTLAFLAAGTKNIFCIYHKDGDIIIACLRYPSFL